MNEESHNQRIDPELETRVAALVLGEASPFERDQLSKTIEQRPELAALIQQLTSVHNLLQDAAKSELPSEDDDWKLSAEKRKHLLAVLSGESNECDVVLPETQTSNIFSLFRRPSLWGLHRVAAIAVGAGLFGLMLMSTLFLRRSSYLALTQQAGFEREYMADGEVYMAESASEPGLYFRNDGADFGTISGDTHPAPTTINEPDYLGRGYAKDPKSALSSNGESLDVDAYGNAGAGSGESQIQLERLGKAVQLEDETHSYSVNGPEPAKPSAVPSSDLDDRPTLRFAESDLSQRKSEATSAKRSSGLDKSRIAGRGIALGDVDNERDGLPSSGWVESGVASEQEQRKLWMMRGGVDGNLPIDTNNPTAPPVSLPEIASLGIEEKEKRFDDGTINHSFDYVMPTPAPSSSFAIPENQPIIAGSKLNRSEVAEEIVLSESLDIHTSRLRRQANRGSQPASISAVDKSLQEKKSVVGLDETRTAVEPYSTFSLHVSDVSFKLAQATLARGEWPDAAKIRIEEFVNAFDYGDPLPHRDEKVSCRLEQSVHPFLQQRNLLRVSMRTAAAGRAEDSPLRLTFLMDNSGSMERIDRQHTVRRAFSLLAQQLKAIDQVTLISFARQPRLVADKISGSQASELVRLVDELPSEGGTNLEAALQLAFEKAQEQQVDGAQNRIVLLTDGAANLGDAKPESLARLITTMRDEGIAFDAAGISAEGLNDEVLEALTRQGDGRYYLLDSQEAADDRFANQIAGALRPSAKNVKVQIEFNPKRVESYKLLGFEKHRLQKEDFRNDTVDAAEMAAAEAGVAVYQFEANPDGEGDIGSVSVRFRDLSSGQMVENRWPIPYQADASRLDQATASLRIAAAAALFAAKLCGEPLGDSVDLKTLADLIAGLPDQERQAKRVQQLLSMINQARQLTGD